MKKFVKVSVMALVAMFAFSTVADAQFGSLNALRKQIGIKTKKEKQQEKALEGLHQEHHADHSAASSRCKAD